MRAWGTAALLVSLAASAAAGAQVPAPAKPAAPAVAPAPPQTSAPPPPPAEIYTYQPEGRRDPFLALTGTGSEPKSVSRRGEGPTALAVADIAVRGVMQSRGSLLAMVEGPDKRTYIVHQGDKFLDGTIKTITPQGLVVEQEVNDPLSLVKRREIRKLLRSLEDTKG